MSQNLGAVDAVQFFIAGDEHNLRSSHVEVTSKELFKNGLPISGGTYDAHMGTTSDEWRCQTCYNKKAKCPGHFGHVLMNYYLLSPMYIEEIIHWLKIICFNCGKLVIDKHSANTVSKQKKLSNYARLTKAAGPLAKCKHCGTVHPDISRDKESYVKIWANDGKIDTQLYTHVIADIFERIPNSVVRLMGKDPISHPRNMVLSVMPMPPNTARPDIKKIGGGRSNNNDATTIAKSIVEHNNKLPAIIPDTIDEKLETSYLMQNMLYFEMIKGAPNSSSKNRITTNTNRAPSSISSRISQKSGRVRRNLMGRRVWLCARSVITCDQALRVDEIGIPMMIAKEIQIPEIVGTHNIDRLQTYFNNKHEYPGCTRVKKHTNGKEYWVGSVNEHFVLEIGDTLYRDLIDGDDVIFNRQPTMLGHSMSCHKIKVLSEGNSIRMNISSCVLYNADFDGDAMNLFFPSSLSTSVEISLISSVGANFISKARGTPLIGCFQDTLASIVEMTHSDVVIDRRTAMDLFKNIDNVEFDKKMYTGRELISKLLPDINFKTTGMFYNKAYAPYMKYKERDINVVIERGQLIQGIMDHKSCGQERSGSIFHAIHNEYGSTVALDTLFNIQQVVNEFAYAKGFTISMADITIPQSAIDEIQRRTSALMIDAQRTTDKLMAGKIIPPLGMTVSQFYETQQIHALALGDSFVGPILSSIDVRNNGLSKLVQMCKKGKMKNLQSIMSAMGSSLINGSRAAKNFGHGRTLPYFPRFDTDPIANGFVPDSFLTGINAKSFMFTAQEARFGVINKALSTSVSGHQGRESIKSMESLIVNNMRQCAKNYQIVQLIYGGNGVDTRRIESVRIPTAMLSDAEMKKQFFVRDAKHQDQLNEEYAQLVKDRDEFRKNAMIIEKTYNDRVVGNKSKSSVNIKRIMDDIAHTFKDEKREKLNIGEAIIAVRAFCNNYPYIFLNRTQCSQKSRIPDHYLYAARFDQILLRSHLNVATLQKYRFSNSMLGLVFDKVLVVAKKSLIDYGSVVGILAAQSISEPMTQHIIDSHHRSGVTGGDADQQTDKITRNDELLLARNTADMQNPSMMLYVLPEYEQNEIKVNEIANEIENMNIVRFLDSLTVFFERYGEPVHPAYVHEKKLIDKYEEHNTFVEIPDDLTKWVIRMEFNRLEMILKSITLEQIIFALARHHPKLHIVHSPENDKCIVVRCYLRNSAFKKAITENIAIEYAHEITETAIRGIPDIRLAKVVKKPETRVCEDGSLKVVQIYVIKTSGTNFSAIMENPHIDMFRSSSDSIKEIESMFGIEAARYMLESELEKLTSGMSRPHYALFADEMCSNGSVTAISKSGLERREPDNIMLRVSHNYMNQTLKNSAVNSSYSKIYGVSAPIMTGSCPQAGTSYNDIAVNTEFVKENTKSIETILDDL